MNAGDMPEEHLRPLRDICDGEVRFMVEGVRRLRARA